MERRRTPLLLLLLCAACGPDAAVVSANDPDASPPPARESWWNEATLRRSGRERVLAPRELRALLAEGRGFGFHADAKWWEERRAWVFERILDLDPDDLEANRATGHSTLQSVPDFRALWERMIVARAPDAAIQELLERWDDAVQEGRPVFLASEEFAEAERLLAAARAHLDRIDLDPRYAALQTALVRVRGRELSDYTYVHANFGPFLVFYAARDLQRIEGEDPAAEDARLARQREIYGDRLERLGSVYGELMADLEKLYPRLMKERALGPKEIFFQWIFADRTWYGDFLGRLGREAPEPTYRSGFFDRATGWAYLFEPEEQKDSAVEGAPPLRRPAVILRETAAYLAAAQLLRHWGKDREAPLANHLDRSQAYWVKEGWPSFLAARRVKQAAVGPLLEQAKSAGWRFPSLVTVVERRSRLDRFLVLLQPRRGEFEFQEPEDVGYTDLAWLLVRQFNHDARRAAFETYLLSLVDGTRPGDLNDIEWFEKSFGVSDTEKWEALRRDVYSRIETK